MVAFLVQLLCLRVCLQINFVLVQEGDLSGNEIFLICRIECSILYIVYRFSLYVGLNPVDVEVNEKFTTSCISTF